MALIRCTFFVETLELTTSMTVLPPQPETAQIGVPEEEGPETTRRRPCCTSCTG